MTENSGDTEQAVQDSGKREIPSKSVWSEPVLTKLDVAMTEAGFTVLGEADTMS
ncbi:hypothetical protein [Parasphingorhabdus sp.]|uniref:hypothetical protein n=1 Tax=Parasphingorhabdus sp. TaxID=2709688 RepID=UPI003A93D6B8